MAASNVGVRIRRAREAAGLSQAELARRLGVSAVTIWRWETGKMEPSLSHFGALASELGAEDFDAAIQWFQGEATPEPEWREFSEKLGRRSEIQEHAMRVIRAEREKVAPSQADIDALTAHVLDAPAVRLALDIRAGGPWALSRTLELARLILASPPADKDSGT